MQHRDGLVGATAILVSSMTFATSGTLVKPLLLAGWSPAAAVIARLLVAAAVLAVPALLSLRGRYAVLWRARRRVLLFAVLGVGLTQLGYFAAVQRIPVGVALLIEYLAPVGLVLLAWATTRRRPALVVLGGTVLAVAGLVLVIGPGGTGGTGGLDPLGIAFALAAAVGLAAYWLLAAQTDDGVPALALTAASLLVGGLMLALLALVGVLPFAVSTTAVPLASWTVPWWLPVVAVALVSTAAAYVTGIVGTARLGSRVASFLGLTEVVFACVFSWLLLGEAIALVQVAGAALLLGGVLLVRSERPSAPPPEGAAQPARTARAASRRVAQRAGMVRP